jgi:alkylglycerol monooxygenase
MSLLVYAFPLFILTLCVECAVAQRRNPGAYSFPDAITSLQIGVLSQVSNAFTKLVTLGIYTAVFETFRVTTWSMNSAWAWLGALLMHDFFYYWFHRCNHEIGVMWAAHVTHHNSEHLNISTAMRQASGTELLRWSFYLPLAVAGVPPMMFITVAIIDLIYGYWNHTELIGKLGWYDRFFGSPSNHRVHHGQNGYCIDKNYGSFLIIWDRMFGTFAEERDAEPVKFGVRHAVASFNPIWANAHVYVELWKQSGMVKGWREKLNVWLSPPGGWPTGPLDDFDGAQFVRFNSNPTREICWYTAAQFGGTLVMLSHFLVVFKQLELPVAATYAALLVVTAVAAGALLERRDWGKRLELVRLAVVGVAVAVMPQWFGSMLPDGARVAIVLTVVAGFVWLVGRDVKTQRFAAGAV